MLITFPVALIFLFSSASPAYTVVMIKVASMGQQANTDKSREMGRSLLESTLWGGIAAIIAWQLLSIWPSLTLYPLLIGLAGLLFGPRIFQGPAVHPRFAMWSYTFLTMISLCWPPPCWTLRAVRGGVCLLHALVHVCFDRHLRLCGSSGIRCFLAGAGQ